MYIVTIHKLQNDDDDIFSPIIFLVVIFHLFIFGFFYCAILCASTFLSCKLFFIILLLSKQNLWNQYTLSIFFLPTNGMDRRYMPFLDAEAMFHPVVSIVMYQMPLIKIINKNMFRYLAIVPFRQLLNSSAFFQPPNIWAGLNGICTSIYLLEYKYSCQHI